MPACLQVVSAMTIRKPMLSLSPFTRRLVFPSRTNRKETIEMYQSDTETQAAIALHRQALVHEAEQERLLVKIHRERSGGRHLPAQRLLAPLGHTLVRTGRWLVSVGMALEGRFSPDSPARAASPRVFCRLPAADGPLPSSPGGAVPSPRGTRPAYRSVRTRLPVRRRRG